MNTDKRTKGEWTSEEIIRELEISNYSDKPTQKANAIVLACNLFPELLEVLEEFISLTKDISNDFNFPILDKAKELIQKAKQ